MSKKGLGRGLGALITERETESSEIKEIMLADIIPNPDQPRRIFETDKLEELAQSIKEHGLLQPILVRPDGSKYYIIAGERRYRASKIAGLDRINCIVRNCSEQEMTEKALIENIQRADLSPVEEGLAYAKLINDFGLTQEQVAAKVGKGRPTIANLLRIIQLPAEILDMLNNEQITLGHAKLLLTVEDENRIDLAHRIQNESLSVRQTEKILSGEELFPPTVSTENEMETKNIKKTKVININQKTRYSALEDIEEKLQTSFQTKVIVKGNDEKGKIEIEYYSKDELNRLLESWNIII